MVDFLPQQVTVAVPLFLLASGAEAGALAASLFLECPPRGFLAFLVIFCPWKDNREITEGHWFGDRG